MDLPNPFKIAKMMKNAIANKDKWEQAYDMHVEGQDEQRRVKAKFYLKTNRFVGLELNSEISEGSILEAVNHALDLADKKHLEAEQEFMS